MQRVRPVMAAVVPLVVSTALAAACSKSDGTEPNGGSPGQADARVTYDTAPIGAMIPLARHPRPSLG